MWTSLATPVVAHRVPTRLVGALVIAALGAFGANTFGQCSYSVEIIPHPYSGLQFTAGLAINDLGHVTGQNSSGGDTRRAFFWSPSTSTVVLPFPPGITNMWASDINDWDQVCGYMYDSSGVWYGFIWHHSSETYTVAQCPAWATRIEFRGINNDGFVTGTTYHDGTGAVRPFLWHDGVLYDLAADFDFPSNRAYAISELDEIVGHAWNGIVGGAFAWSSSNAVQIYNDGYLAYSEATENSNNGAAVGNGSPVLVGQDGFRRVGAIWQPNVTTLLEPRPTSRDAIVYGINDAGRAVGGYSRTTGADSGFVWQNGRLTLLNELVPKGTPNVASARCINNAGQIVVGAGGHARVLTPVWVAGDVTGDCHVSIEDLILVLSNFGRRVGSYPQGDVNNDGAVDLNDLTILLANWGE